MVTNYLCIVLTNLWAKKYYLKLCECLDIQFRKCCLKIINKDKETITNLAISIEMNFERNADKIDSIEDTSQ